MGVLCGSHTQSAEHIQTWRIGLRELSLGGCSLDGVFFFFSFLQSAQSAVRSSWSRGSGRTGSSSSCWDSSWPWSAGRWTSASPSAYKVSHRGRTEGRKRNKGLGRFFGERGRRTWRSFRTQLVITLGKSHNLWSIIPDPQNSQLDLPFVRKEIKRSDIRKSSFPEKCIFRKKHAFCTCNKQQQKS